MVTQFIVNNPIWGIIVVSFVITLIITLIHKYTTDQEKLKQAKEEMKEIKAEMKEYRNDPQKTMELNKKLMAKSMESTRQTFKPMLISFLPVIIIFAWLRNSLPIDEVLIQLPFSIPKMGVNTGFGWFAVYIVTAIIFSSVLRKVMKVY